MTPPCIDRLRKPWLWICAGTAVLALPAGGAEVLLEGGKHILVERNVAMATRDGVTLRADVFRPEGDGKYPVVLERTPYDKRGEGFGPQVASHGYVFITQDVRGRFASDGDWYPFRNEEKDGYDAVEWAAALPYSNGKVGMYGPSYLSACQLLAAVAAPPHLACIMPFAMGPSAHDWIYMHGAFSQALVQGWTSAVSVNAVEKAAGRSAQPSHWDMKRSLADYPVLEPLGRADYAPHYLDWVRHPEYDDYWRPLSIVERIGQVRVPALHIGAWYDYFEEGSIRNFLMMRSYAGTDAARRNQRLVMIVGGHAGAGPKVGDVDFGKDSVLDIGGLALKWYDFIMKGADNGMAAASPVRLFVMGENRWIDASDWPLPEMAPQRYLLASSGRANGSGGDGVLDGRGGGPADRFTADPANPVPTVGGPAFGDAGLRPGPQDQRDVEKRTDVLVYSTPPLAADVRVIGPVSLDLFVETSGADADFTGKLVDVGPDGRAIDISEGIQRLRYRDSNEHPSAVDAGAVYHITVDMGSTANTFLKGHRIRAEVSGSNFPRFDRNLNTGSTSGQGRVATNQVLHDALHPSALVVGVVPPQNP